MVQKRSWLHARSIVFVLSRFPLSQPFHLSGKAWCGAKLAAVAFIVLLLFAFRTTGCCKVHFGCVCDMQPVHDEMPVVIKIIAQLLYDNNLPINNYIVLCPHGC